MQIGMLAELAGVTVRTVRYYHQAGVLTEPPRRSNGYRNYSVDDLVTVLRIRQLTATGLSMSQAHQVLTQSPGADLDDVIAAADQALAEQIAALTAQRTRLAQARSASAVGLTPLAAALMINPGDLSAAVLVAHLLGDGPQSDQLIKALTSAGMRASLTSLQERFDQLDDSTPAADLEALEDQVKRVITELEPYLPAVRHTSYQLAQDLSERGLNDRQKAFMRSLG